jgi:hypothetical protein
MNFEENVRSSCPKGIASKLELETSDRLKIDLLQIAIVFVFSSWSGIAIRSFKLLTEALIEISGHEFTLFVLDADKINLDAFKDNFCELPQGKGETYWIKAGQITHSDHGYNDASKEVLRSRIRDFFAK